MKKSNIAKLFINNLREELAIELKSKGLSNNDLKRFLRETSNGDILSLILTKSFIPDNVDKHFVNEAFVETIKELIRESSDSLNDDQDIVNETIASLDFIEGDNNSIFINELDFKNMPGQGFDMGDVNNHNSNGSPVPIVMKAASEKARSMAKSGQVSAVSNFLTKHSGQIKSGLLVALISTLAFVAYKKYKQKQQSKENVEELARRVQIQELNKAKALCSKSKTPAECKKRIDEKIAEIKSKI